MLAKLRHAAILALALSLPATAAYAAEAPKPAAAHTVKQKPKHVKKTNAKTKGRWAGTNNPNVRASHKKVVKHTRAAAKKKKSGSSQSATPVVGTKV